MTRNERAQIAARVVSFICRDGEKTHDALVELGSKYGAEIENILALVRENKDISVATDDETLEVIYRKKRRVMRRANAAEERAKIEERVRDLYPKGEINTDAIPFKICMCSSWRTDDGEVWEPGMPHNESCDAVRFPDEFKSQYKHLKYEHA